MCARFGAWDGYLIYRNRIPMCALEDYSCGEYLVGLRCGQAKDMSASRKC